jgi:hypothetical protein
MSKYALIQNIGGLTCLLCHLLPSRRFSGHFVELSRPILYIIYYYLFLSAHWWAAVTAGELGQCLNLTKLADKILPNASQAAAIHIYVYSIFPNCKIL